MPGEALAMLVNKIDAMVVAEKEKKLAAVVNFLGDADDEKMIAKVKNFGEKHAFKKVPLAITGDGDSFKISDGAEVSVMLYRGKKVMFNYALDKGGLNRKTIAAIVADTKKMLAEPPEKPKPKDTPDAKVKEKPKAKTQTGE
jgi:hypothetical protein